MDDDGEIFCRGIMSGTAVAARCGLPTPSPGPSAHDGALGGWRHATIYSVLNLVVAVILFRSCRRPGQVPGGDQVEMEKLSDPAPSTRAREDPKRACQDKVHYR